MHLQFSLEKMPTPGEAERLAKAFLILGGSDAIVSRAIQGSALTRNEMRGVVDHVALVEQGDTPDTRVHLPPVDESVVADDAVEAQLHQQPPLDDAAALLAQGGANPPSDAGTATPTASPSASVVAPPPATSAPTAGDPVRLDAAGMPYDARIHSGAMSQKKDGTWTAKRGVSELLISQIESEHRAAGYGNAAHAGAAVSNVAPPPSTVAPPPAVAGPPAAAPAADPEAFKALVSVMGAAMSGGSLTKAQIDGALATLGLKAVPDLQQRADLIETFKLHLGL